MKWGAALLAGILGAFFLFFNHETASEVKEYAKQQVNETMLRLQIDDDIRRRLNATVNTLVTNKEGELDRRIGMALADRIEEQRNTLLDEAVKQVQNSVANVDLEERLLPPGSVLAWLGEGALPEGWQACDGSNGTPNLQGRFLAGADDSSQIHDVGGVLRTATAGAHSHSGTTAIGRQSGFTPGQASHWGQASNYLKSHRHTFETDEKGAHSHGDNRPPFYTVNFICAKGK